MTTYNKTDPDVTKKLPPKPDVTTRSDIAYPYIGGYGGFYGEHNIFSQFGDVTKAFTQKYDVLSGYHIRENTQSGHSVIHDLLNGHVFKYISGGTSDHTDGNIDKATKGQHHDVTKGSKGIETGKTTYDGSGDARITGTGGSGTFENHTGGNKFTTTSGDHVSQHDGHIHNSVKGDKVEAVVGNKYDTVNGDKGVYVQNGNYDILVAGKTNIAASSAVTISSPTSITLTVGQSSINITQNGITITGFDSSGQAGLNLNGTPNIFLTANGGVITASPPITEVSADLDGGSF